MTWVLDCDGVIWLGEEALPGTAEAVDRLRQAGERVVFLTNNSYPLLEQHLAKLDRLGMSTRPGDVISSAMAAARLVSPGERALVLGGPGIFEALVGRGVETVEAGAGAGVEAVDVVVVGFDLKFDFARLAAATSALRGGARLVATNDDATFPTSGGLLPGAGAFLAAVSLAGGVTAEIAGKPHEAVVDLLVERVGSVATVVGDRPSTDGRLATRLGARFALVLTGVTPPGHGTIDPEPDIEAADLASIVDRELPPVGAS
ncbi:MAG: HAD-IIA family hydrolase [Actinomycetota bacterium]|nr:HAD-IIA family hydrolase [Actinomycetota bacterium]